MSDAGVCREAVGIVVLVAMLLAVLGNYANY
jgi:hypothetical protein